MTQKGRAFPQPLDMSIDGGSGQVTVRYSDEHGRRRLRLNVSNVPPDLANGLILTVLKNVQAQRSAQDSLSHCRDAKATTREAGHHRRRR